MPAAIKFVDGFERTAARHFGDARAMGRQRIDDANQRGLRQARQHAGVIATHYARADDANTQRTFCIALPVQCNPFWTHPVNLGYIPVAIFSSRTPRWVS